MCDSERVGGGGDACGIYGWESLGVYDLRNKKDYFRVTFGSDFICKNILKSINTCVWVENLSYIVTH